MRSTFSLKIIIEAGIATKPLKPKVLSRMTLFPRQARIVFGDNYSY